MVRAAQDRAQACNQFPRIERFHHVVIRAGFQPDDLVHLVTAPRQHHDRDAKVFANKLCQLLAQPYQLPQGTAQLSASIGIARFPADGDCAQALISYADAAMYQAKSMGRNRFVIFNDTMREQLLQAMTLEQVMQQALERARQDNQRAKAAQAGKAGAVLNFAVGGEGRGYTDADGNFIIRRRPRADLPILRIVGGKHFVSDLTLPHGRVLFDYLKDA